MAKSRADNRERGSRVERRFGQIEGRQRRKCSLRRWHGLPRQAPYLIISQQKLRLRSRTVAYPI
jgi:hypothetical protein